MNERWLLGSGYTMLGRELVYTAVTRAKSLLVLVGPRKALLRERFCAC